MTVFSTYLRGYNYRGRHYLLGMPGVLYRSHRADGDFTPRDRLLLEPVMRPDRPWEGSELPPIASIRGELNLSADELRDLYLFQDKTGENYLFYVGAGEQAIGVARVR